MKIRLQEQISLDLIASMKQRDKEKTSILRVVIGEFARKYKEFGTKELSDDVVINVVKKVSDDTSDENEVKILSEYLPTVLSEVEVEELVKGIISSNGFEGMGDMGKVMGILKSQYSGTYDGKFASQIVKNNL